MPKEFCHGCGHEHDKSELKPLDGYLWCDNCIKRIEGMKKRPEVTP